MLCFFAFSRIRCGFHRNVKHHGSCVNAGIFRLAVRREIQADCSAVIRGSACYGEYGIIFRDDALPVLYRVKLLGAFRGFQFPSVCIGKPDYKLRTADHIHILRLNLCGVSQFYACRDRNGVGWGVGILSGNCQFSGGHCEGIVCDRHSIIRTAPACRLTDGNICRI